MGLVVAPAVAAARRLGGCAGDRTMIFLAMAVAQVSVVSVALSLFHGYAPLPFLAAQCVFVGAASAVIQRRRPVAFEGATTSVTLGARAVEMALLIAILGVIGHTLAEQLLVPVSGWDERMYNASRAAYWLHYKSVFPYLSHNDRQVTFPFGAELFFGWPLLFTRQEAFARVGIWAAFPLGILGLFHLARAVGCGRAVSLAVALVYAATPTVLYNAAASQKQDLWTQVYVVATAYWVVRTLPDAPGKLWRLWLAACMAVFAINVKITAATLVPALGAAALFSGQRRGVAQRLCWAIWGGIAGFVLSGLWITIGVNLLEYRSPFGNPRFSKVGNPDFSLVQTWVHVVRTPFLLFELPAVPWEGLRGSLTSAGRGLIALLGAERMLPGEETKVWPDHYMFNAPARAEKYSLGGMLWLPFLIAGCVALLREARATIPWVRLSGRSWVVVIGVPMLGGLVFMVRWMGGAAERYWIGAYALGLVVTISFIGRWLRRPQVAAAGLLMLIATVAPAVRSQQEHLEWAMQANRDPQKLDEPFFEAAALTPPGSRVLLVGSQNIRDYPLFRPRDGYPNAVFSWGKAPADPARLDRLIEQDRATHVLFEDNQAVGFHWDGGLRVTDLVARMETREDFIQIPLRDARQRLFAKVRIDSTIERPPFVGWTSAQGLDAQEGPYPPRLPVIRWGTGMETRLAFKCGSEPLLLVLECRRNNDPKQSLRVLCDGAEIVYHEFGAAGEFERVAALVRAKPGNNELVIQYHGFEVPNPASPRRQLAVLYRKLQLLPQPRGSP